MTKYELAYAKTPKQFIDMYVNNSAKSCMSKGSSYLTKTGRDLLKEKGLWASMWYAYYPDLKGIMLKKNGKLISRQFLYKNKYLVGPLYGFPNHIGGYYGWNNEYHDGTIGIDEEAYNGLTDKAGYKKHKNEYLPMVHMEVPRVTHNRRILCPLPFIDIIVNSFFVSYDSTKRKFIFDPKKGHHAIYDVYDYPMWLEVGGITGADR